MEYLITMPAGDELEELRRKLKELDQLRREHWRLALRPLEAADALGVSYDFFTHRIAPELRTVRVGRLKLYPVAEIERWLSEHAEPLFGP